MTAKDSIATMASIVTLYLLGNSLNVFITLIEHIDKDFLYKPGIIELYALTADLISLLTVCTSALRLPLYMVANRVIRKEVLKTIDTMCCGQHIRKRIRQLFRRRQDRTARRTEPKRCSYHLVTSSNGASSATQTHTATPSAPPQSCLLAASEGPVAANQKTAYCSQLNGLYPTVPPAHYHSCSGNGRIALCILEEHELDTPLESRV